MPIVSLIVTPDKIHPNPVFQEYVTDGRIDNPRTEMSREDLSQVIENIYKLAKKKCVRKSEDPHTCVTIGTRSYDNGDSIHVDVVYVHGCFNNSWNESHFIEAIKNRMNMGRVASYTVASHDATVC